MGTYWKTEGIQSYLRIWRSYGPIESGPSERKKGGLYGCSVKKSDLLPLFGPKIGPDAPQEPALQHGQHKKVVIFVSRHDGNKKIWRASPKNGFLSKKQHFWPQKGLFWAIRARKQPAKQPNGHLPENQMYPKLPQDMGKL